MADFIKIDITGVRRAGIRFDAFPDALYEDLRKEITALSAELLGRVEARTPDRTGRLRGQERVRVFADKDHIKGQVDVEGDKGSQDFAKAASLEYGAHGATKVGAHEMRLDHHWAEKMAAAEMVIVQAYTRSANIAEVAFERGPLAEMQPEIVARLNAVVEKAAAEANA